jgi:hypothetical protein
MAWLTAVPMAPEEPSTCWRAGDTRSNDVLDPDPETETPTLHPIVLLTPH